MRARWVVVVAVLSVALGFGAGYWTSWIVMADRFVQATSAATAAANAAAAPKPVDKTEQKMRCYALAKGGGSGVATNRCLRDIGEPMLFPNAGY